MGIDDLWMILEPVSQARSFKQLCVEEGFQANRRNQGVVIIGVDASVWMIQCQAVFWHARHAQAGRNPELRTLFYKLVHLNASGAVAVFVFDGPNRPSIKRNTQVVKKPHWLTTDFQKLIALFGFYSYTAPGEAEAELAALNRLNLVDMVLSSDNDAFIFGATQVVRSLDKDRPDEIKVYTSKAIQESSSLGIKLGGLLLIALLCGGDYDMVGLRNCGINTALGLARCGFGDTLLTAASTLSCEGLSAFLATWREDLRSELSTNSQGHLRGRRTALAASISPQFPNIDIILLYIQPVTSWSGGGVPPDPREWKATVPDLPSLAQYCADQFGWNALDIATKFKKLLFPGICFRRLVVPYDEFAALKDHILRGRVDEEHPPLSAYLHIRKRQFGPAPLTLKTYTLEIATGLLTQLTLSRLHNSKSVSKSADYTASDTIKAVIPAALVQRFFAAMVKKFEDALPGGFVNSPHPPARALLTPLDNLPRPQMPRGVTWLGLIDLTRDDGQSCNTADPTPIASGSGQGKGSRADSEEEVIDLTGDSSDSDCAMDDGGAASDDSDVMVLN
ncbi:PIN domain-like protein [Mycena latifolia]|nr:PIN domain-like protein [Mycena latifolia]